MKPAKKYLPILPIILFLSLFLFYLLPPVDPDLGWHLRYGQYIFQNHRVMRENEIGFFLPHYQWPQSYSLYQLTLFLIYRLGSFWGIAISGALVSAAIFTPFIFLKKLNPWLILIIPMMIFFLAPVTSLGYRSQLWSVLGCSLLYWFLIQEKPFSKKYLFLFPLAFALWTNLHGGFVLGLALIAIALGEAVLQKNFARAKFLGLILATSFLATFLNPFGGKIYQEIIRHSWYPLNKLIAEWTPPGRIHFAALSFISILIALILGADSLSKNRPQAKIIPRKKHFLFLLVSGVFFTFLGLKARRHLPFFGLAAANFFLASFPSPRLLKKGKIGIILLSLSFILIRVFHWPQIDPQGRFICQSKVSQPCAAVAFLKENPHLCHRLYHAYEWGGFLDWQLPNIKTFVDGRMPAWPTPAGKSPYTIYLEIIQARPGFNQRLINYGADCLLIGRGTFLDLALKEKPSLSWQPIYEDKQAVLYQYQPQSK